MGMDERLESIIKLKLNLEHMFFKEFMMHYVLPESINHTHMMTLLIMRLNPQASMVDLSRQLNLEKGSFTPVAHKLLQLGYISKEQDPKDRRVFKLSLTDKGLEAAKTFEEGHRAYIKKLIETIDPEDMERFFASAQFINETMKSFKFSE
ncbi:MarR family transcriptional regulator [uncultured Sphaerochaeta sp.]|uniref:MarR family winged helix-turn-helix transcriptional regulator n=1 Tax=uncultured Sphaerochaeta sp. TaxID=886478 RepID=UPI002A0A7942|nr:MarR family transcriptional regulator [uncultured Sphaerochaeta sp.]